jgi:hypothetical protein
MSKLPLKRSPLGGDRPAAKAKNSLDVSPRGRKRLVLRELDELHVLDELTPKQRARLARIVLEIIVAQERSANPTWRRDGAGQIRTLGRRVDKLQKAFDDLDKYWTRLGGGPTPTPDLTTLPDAIDEHFGFSWTLDRIRIALDELTAPARFDPEPAPSKIAITERLFEFFKTECGRNKSTSSRLTARVGNAFFGWKINERDQHDSHNPERSRAVLKALARRAKRR